MCIECQKFEICIAAVGTFITSIICNSKKNGWQHYECHSVVSSGRSEPPRRMLLAWLSQCVSTAQRDVEHRLPAETASSLGVVGVRRCTAERKSTEPCVWWPLFCTVCAVRQAASGETLIAVWRRHICAADRWAGRRCFELCAASRRLQQERHIAASCSSRFCPSSDVTFYFIR